MMSNLRVHLALITVQVLFGSWPVVGKMVLTAIPGTALVGVRAMGAAGLMLLLAPGRARALPLAMHPQAAWAGLLGVTVNQLLFVGGLARTSAINATVITTTIPIFTLLFAVLRKAEPLRARTVVGLLVSASGAAVATQAWHASLDPAVTVGNLMLLGNSAAYALYLVELGRLTRTHPPLGVVPWVFFYGALFALPVAAPALWHGGLLPWSPAVLGGMAFIILGPTVVTYLLNAVALQHAHPSLVSLYVYLQPLVAAALAALLLGEAPGLHLLAGGVLIFLGLAVVTRPLAAPARGAG